jgi:hypothetical protein
MARDTFMRTSEMAQRGQLATSQQQFQASRDLGAAIGNIPVAYQQARARELAMTAEQLRQAEYYQRIDMYSRELMVREQAARTQIAESQARKVREESQDRLAKLRALKESFPDVPVTDSSNRVIYPSIMSDGSVGMKTLPPDASARVLRQFEAGVRYKETMSDRMEQGRVGTTRSVASPERMLAELREIITWGENMGMSQEDIETARESMRKILRNTSQGNVPIGPSKQKGPPNDPSFRRAPGQASQAFGPEPPWNDISALERLPGFEGLSPDKQKLYRDAWAKATPGEREDILNMLKR